MTELAPHLTAFLREHLPRERRASVHTCEAYAYSFQLLVTFAAQRLRTRPCRLRIAGSRRGNDTRLPATCRGGAQQQGSLSERTSSGRKVLLPLSRTPRARGA